MNIMVALSGGVDSAVAALLMLEQGHAVVGVTMSIWREGSYRGGERDACFGPKEKDDIEAAAIFCRNAGIRHIVVDCADAYEQIVLENFRREFMAGRTPNPCLRCNAEIKLGLLPSLAGKDGLPTGSLVATGHYARVIHDSHRNRLCRPVDLTKDQSYFLCRLGQEQLARLITPLGELTKAQVRAIARRNAIAMHDKPDSQDFYSGDYRELLGVAPRTGKIIDVSGKQLGTHQGYWNFTVGQRKGLCISHRTPLYVVGIIAESNTVVVGEQASILRHTLKTTGTNWVSIDKPGKKFMAELAVRSPGMTVPCTVTPHDDGNFTADFPEGISAVAPGQTAVLYENEILLGAGVIESAW